MRIRLVVTLAFVCALALPSVADDTKTQWSYPDTKTGDDVDVMHGETIADPYRWLEDDFAKDVEAWDNAQMAVTMKYLESLPEREAMRGRVGEEFGVGGMPSLPRFEGGRRWFTYRPPGKSHAVLYVTDNDATVDPKVVLDPNTWSESGTAGLSDWAVSPDGSLVAYRRDDKGSEDTTLYIRDVVTGKDLGDVIPRTKFSSLVWDVDGKGIYYSRMPDPELVPEAERQYHRRVHYHRIGAIPLDDPIVYGQDRPMLESKWVYRTSDKNHYFIARGLPYRSVDTFELTRTDHGWDLEPMVVGAGDRTWVDRAGDWYIFNTDRFRGERDICVMKRVADGWLSTRRGDQPVAKKLAMELLPTHFRPSHGVGGVVEDTFVLDPWIVLHAKENVVSRIWVSRLDNPDHIREIELPAPGTVSGIQTKDGDTRIWLRFESYSTPPTTYSVDVAADHFELKAEEVLPTTIDPDMLVSEQMTYTSKDGTDVPIFILRRKDVKLDGTAPTVLYGYGGFRVSLFPRFSRTRALWAEMGGVFCVANLRGGNEFGEAWHQGGCLANKQNVYDDFIAAADWLVNTGKSSREKLAIQGGSNGGLLTAVVANQRPDLCAAGISGVPLTDMLRYHRFQFAKSWTKEYGDPDVKEEFDWIRPYSPYHNVTKGATYPAMYVTSGLHDGRVNPFHARKMAARWQAEVSRENPILLWIDRESGHGSSSIDHYQKELVDEFSFLFLALDAKPEIRGR